MLFSGDNFGWIKLFASVTVSVGKPEISMFDAGFIDLKIMPSNEIEGYQFLFIFVFMVDVYTATTTE